MKISDIGISVEEGATVLSGRVWPDGERESRLLWFRFAGHEAPVAPTGDTFAAAMLPFCMAEGEDLHVDAPVSPTLLRNLGNAQGVLSGWYDFLRPVAVESAQPEDATAEKPGPGIACCFSGGVDSWYSLLSHLDRVTHLFLIRGFDIGLENDTLWAASCGAAQEVGRWLEKPVVTCETNLRLVADKRRADWGMPFEGDFWGRCLHGAALAATVHALGGDIGELIVPATHTHDQLKPWGSSPMLDRFWSNGSVQITHDSCDADRVEKVGMIASSQLALDTLRVCHHDVEEVNCGQCEKCLRTMMALHLHGALERASTFPGPEAFARYRRLEIPPNQSHHYDVLLAAARRLGDTEMVRLLEISTGRRFSAERSLALIARRLRRSGLSAPLRSLKRQVA